MKDAYELKKFFETLRDMAQKNLDQALGQVGGASEGYKGHCRGMVMAYGEAAKATQNLIDKVNAGKSDGTY